MIDQLALFRLLTGLRRTMLWIVISLAISSIATFFISPMILAILQEHLHQELAYFAISEPFFGRLKLSLAASLFALAPVMIVLFWRTLAAPFGLSRRAGCVFVPLAILLFYSGAAFCYFLTLPFGVEFLLGYQSAHVKAVISLDRFLTFCFAFILAFAVMFELPLAMIFSVRIKLCSADFFKRYRRYALLLVAVVSAIATPTPDVFNMMLMMAPLYALYELGILAMRVMGL
ncbi:MAG: twin-arginine translocase subunit TatC [Pseudomonadota bacterium]